MTVEADEKRPTDKIVFGVAGAIVLAFMIWGFAGTDSLGNASARGLDWVTHNLGWAFARTASGFVAFALWIAFGRYGRIPLGADDEKPEFRTSSWIAMMFSAGMGIGLMFFGVNEPLTFFTDPVSVVWFCIFGGSAINLQGGGEEIAGTAENPTGQEEQLFSVLEHFPLTAVASVIVMMLVAIFFVSGADAASIVTGTLSQRGSIEPNKKIVIFWGVLMGSVAAIMLMIGGGGAAALEGLEKSGAGRPHLASIPAV